LAHGIGITKGGRNTKLHAVCDEKGRPHVLLLTPGNTHDAKVAIQTINAVPPSQYLVADKGYDSNALRSWLIERGTTPVIPSKSNRKVQIEHDRQIYRQRNVVERMFCRFKDWRRVATRFDRNIKTFMATIAIAATASIHEIGMPLQMDSTVHYISGRSGDVFTTAEERASDSPYNTYTQKGLPPGPIEAPGDAAIDAAANPADGPWFFYVTVNLRTGETKFTDDYDEFLGFKRELDEYCATQSDRC